MQSLLFLIKTVFMLLMARGGFRVGYPGLALDPTWLYDDDGIMLPYPIPNRSTVFIPDPFVHIDT